MLRLRLVRSVLRRGTRGHEPFFRLYLELALSFAPGPGKRPRPEKPFALLTLTRDLDRDPIAGSRRCTVGCRPRDEAAREHQRQNPRSRTR